MELARVSVFAEAGAVVQPQVLLRDTNVPGVDPQDSRQLDLVAWGLRSFGRPNPYGDLTVLACETGGRWHDTARSMVSRLVQTRVEREHPLLRRAAALAYHRRWWSLLSVALQHTVVSSLLDTPEMGGAPGAGPEA